MREQKLTFYYVVFLILILGVGVTGCSFVVLYKSQDTNTEIDQSEAKKKSVIG